MRTLLCVLLLTTLCLANDRGIDGVGGSWQVLEGEHSTVQMVEEDVQMNVYPRLTFTLADFVFTNHGDACVVTMGFPESGAGDIPWMGLDKTSRFLSFRSLVDGSEVTCQRAKVKYGEESYQTHWIKRVSFARGQTRRVRVEYVSRSGQGAGFQYASYHFTGGNWQGKVNRSHLTLVIHPANFKYTPYPGDPTVWNRRGGEVHFEARNWEAERGVSYYYEPDRSGSLLAGWNGNESGLRGRSARDLTLMRNEIYARYGRSFQDSALREYFQSQPWYREWSGYSDAVLTPTERLQAETILKYQRDHKLMW